MKLNLFAAEKQTFTIYLLYGMLCKWGNEERRGVWGFSPRSFLKNCTFLCNLGAGLLPFGALGQYPLIVFGTLHAPLKGNGQGGSGGSPPGKFFKIATQKMHFETVWYNMLQLLLCIGNSTSCIMTTYRHSRSSLLSQIGSCVSVAVHQRRMFRFRFNPYRTTRNYQILSRFSEIITTFWYHL